MLPFRQLPGKASLQGEFYFLSGNKNEVKKKKSKSYIYLGKEFSQRKRFRCPEENRACAQEGQEAGRAAVSQKVGPDTYRPLIIGCLIATDGVPTGGERGNMVAGGWVLFHSTRERLWQLGLG